MNRWPVVAAAAVLVTGLALVKSCRDRVELAGEIARRDSTITALERVRDSLKRERYTDTLATNTIIDRWHTQTLPGTTDTLPGRVDTLWQVRQIIETGNQLVAACQLERKNCSELLHVDSTIIDSLKQNEKDLAKAARGCRVFGVLPCPIITAGVGAVLNGGTVRAGPSISVGIPIRF